MVSGNIPLITIETLHIYRRVFNIPKFSKGVIIALLTLTV